jgi:hypothetical protein
MTDPINDIIFNSEPEPAQVEEIPIPGEDEEEFLTDYADPEDVTVVLPPDNAWDVDDPAIEQPAESSELPPPHYATFMQTPTVDIEAEADSIPYPYLYDLKHTEPVLFPHSYNRFRNIMR